MFSKNVDLRLAMKGNEYHNRSRRAGTIFTHLHNNSLFTDQKPATTIWKEKNVRNRLSSYINRQNASKLKVAQAFRSKLFPATQIHHKLGDIADMFKKDEQQCSGPGTIKRLNGIEVTVKNVITTKMYNHTQFVTSKQKQHDNDLKRPISRIGKYTQHYISEVSTWLLNGLKFRMTTQDWFSRWSILRK